MNSAVSAAVQHQEVTYQHAGTELKGYLAWDDSIQGPRPGVLVVHEWWGLNDYARSRADQLAALGYTAFALDMYGAGKSTTHPQEAGQWATQTRNNVQEWRARALAGLDVLKGHATVDPERLAAIGYCFGGSTVLQLAYGGAPVKGVVSFHGDPVLPEEGTKIAASVLLCHGYTDEFIPPARIDAFEARLEKAGADFQVIVYGGTRHGFTNPGADKHNIPNIKYNQDADHRSWEQMKIFLTEIFARKQ
ncbi:dienelactone hydrolase family protein [Planctomicrobium sp. SH664]|uniref:dienelactone hydrolase family protein n=1 Tax=Planctomicrobium sp. SH664 TaxID=3448125 RepID=UPI003F5AEF13